MNAVRREQERVETAGTDTINSSQYDSDDDLAVFDAGRAPTQPFNPDSSSRSRSQQQQHYASNPDPFANEGGVYDSYVGQNQNPASYGGGQAANRFGTAVDVSTQHMQQGGDDDDTYDPYL